MSGLNLTAADDDAINELERASAAAERSRIVALLRTPTPEMVDELSRLMFERIDASLTEDTGLSERRWADIDAWERNQEHADTRFFLAALSDLIERSDA